MKRNIIILLTLAAGASSSFSADWIDEAASKASDQLVVQAEAIDAPGKFPRALFTDYSIPQVAYHLERDPKEFYTHTNLREHPTLDNYLSVIYGKYSDWTAGFFPGALWIAYELTGREDLRDRASYVTNQLLPVSYMTSTHDLGFMVNCSYGNALRLAPSDSIRDVMLRTADNLVSRYDANIGCIRSWDFGEWNYPVIIDNMMNLQLLFNASKLSGNDKYRNVAVTHALTTLKNHFRDDYTSYHVVSYTADGGIESKGTFQGKAHDSAWARGQAWALYGYTDCYRETRMPEFLEQACGIADMIMSKNMAPDLVPYWDLDARNASDTPRDASAGAIYASALIELSTLVPPAAGSKYKEYAVKLLRALASPEYTANVGENGGFVLMHSTGSLPHGSEIDTPLIYADYYYLEALLRLRRVDSGLTASDWAFSK